MANSDRNSECHYAANQPPPGENFALETYGKNSRCFLTDQWKKSNGAVTSTQNLGSACYQVLLSIIPDSSCRMPNQNVSSREETPRTALSDLDWNSSCKTSQLDKAGNRSNSLQSLQYRCDNGLFEIVLSTLTTVRCLHEGQKVDVHMVDREGWLHEFHIICPAREAMCSSASLVVPVTWTIATLSLLALKIPLI